MIAAGRRTVKSGRRAAHGTRLAPGDEIKARSRGRRSGAEAAGTRERLFRQAQRLFAGKGYGATSLRELAKVAGVRLFTIQHHFGSKQQLYAEIIRRWDREVQELVSRVLAEHVESAHLIERVVNTLFDFFLANRARVALNARAVLGEGVPRRLVLTNHNWVRFVNANMETHQLSASGLDIGLLLITVEGILHNHVLAAPHYRHLCGRDVTDAAVAARVKRHLTQVILRLVGGNAAQLQ
jgi:AcrR family transcriptional regulator